MIDLGLPIHRQVSHSLLGKTSFGGNQVQVGIILLKSTKRVNGDGNSGHGVTEKNRLFLRGFRAYR